MNNNALNWVVFIVLRLAVFLVPLGILLLLQIPPYTSIMLAAVIGIALSILLLSKLRGQASKSIYDRRLRSGKLNRDQATKLGEEEDAAVDAALAEAEARTASESPAAAPGAPMTPAADAPAAGTPTAETPTTDAPSPESHVPADPAPASEEQAAEPRAER